MKITEQIAAPTRTIVLIVDEKATPELSEFFEHIEDRINLSFVGTGTPEGNITAGEGSIYHRLDGGTSTSFYVGIDTSCNKSFVRRAFMEPDGWFHLVHSVPIFTTCWAVAVGPVRGSR